MLKRLTKKTISGSIRNIAELHYFDFYLPFFINEEYLRIFSLCC